MTAPSFSSPLAAAFFKPLLELSIPAHLDRTCHGIEESEWLLIGASRIHGADASGRAFLDAHQPAPRPAPASSTPCATTITIVAGQTHPGNRDRSTPAPEAPSTRQRGYCVLRASTCRLFSGRMDDLERAHVLAVRAAAEHPGEVFEILESLGSCYVPVVPTTDWAPTREPFQLSPQ